MKAIASSTLTALVVIAVAPAPAVALLLAVVGAMLVMAAIVRVADALARAPREGWQAPPQIRAREAATRRDRVPAVRRGTSC